MIEIRPQPKQEIFLSNSADIVIFGGSAGGGKSYALLLEPLRHITNPKFGAVIFRRSVPEITRQGGLWDEAKNLYPLLGGAPNETDKLYRFKSGACVSFAHIQDEKDLQGWRGAQIVLMEFDQLETFTEYQFFYMLSRNRSMCGVSPYVRATCNPEPGWLADFVSWWIADDGYADLSRSGVIRWMVRISDRIIWADTKDELTQRFPKSFPKSVTFILSTIYDNQILLDKDPEYLANLQAQSLVDRERLLGDPIRGGNWKIKPAAGKVFNRAWFEIVPAVPSGGSACRRWDFAGSNKEIKGSDPDHTAGVLMYKNNGVYYILDVYDEQISAGAVERVVKNTCFQDRQMLSNMDARYAVRWEEEPGSASKRDTITMVKLLAGLDARPVVARGDKLSHWKPLAAQAEAGNVKLLAGAWNEKFLRAVHGVPDLTHDDIPDAAAGAFEMLFGSGTWVRGMKG